MKLDKAQTILNRINRMFDDVAEAGGTASSLERDLIKEYIRRLYESLNEQENEVSTSASLAKKAEAPEKKVYPPVAEIRRPKAAPQPSNAEEEVTRKASSPKPRVIEIPASVEADIKEMEAKAAFKPASVPVDNTATVVTQVPIAEQKPSFTPQTTSTGKLPSAIQSIFEGEKSNDLSEKLAGAPINDLNRSMAINERLLAQNELFGGNKVELDQALSHLNSLGSYDAAVNYLGHGPAIKYDWSEGERLATARAFAKLVRRRYT